MCGYCGQVEGAHEATPAMVLWCGGWSHLCGAFCTPTGLQSSLQPPGPRKALGQLYCPAGRAGLTEGKAKGLLVQAATHASLASSPFRFPQVPGDCELDLVSHCEDPLQVLGAKGAGLSEWDAGG